MRGFVHPSFRLVEDALRLCVPEGRPGGAAVSVYHHGVKVVDLAHGTADAAGRPFTPETLSVSMSTTKGVAATALHVLISRGEVRLDDPVARYWPEFAQAGKARMTVRQALAHQAGLHEVAPLVTRFEQLYDWEHMVDALARATPRHEPGEDFGYHAFTYGWLVGEIARRVLAVRTYPEVLDTLLGGPLGVDGLRCGVPDADLGRCADMVGLRTLPAVPGAAAASATFALDRLADALRLNTEPREAAAALFPPGIAGMDLNAEAFRKASMPAVNGHFTASALAKLYAALAGDGSVDGVRLLDVRTRDEARRDHNGYGTICRVIPFPLRIKLGYHRAISLGLRLPLGPRSLDLGVASPESFGHFGFGGSGAWADPERGLGVGLVTNAFFGKLPMDLRTVAVVTAAAAAADRVDGRTPLRARAS